MGSSPKPPDPYQTANAQTNANITAGQASAVMNNPDQYGPGGSRVTQQSGWQQIYDPNSGKMINAPKYRETTKLSPDEQRIYGLNTQGRYNLGQTAVEQSAKLRGLLNKNVDTQGLQDWALGPAPGQLQTSLGNAGDIRQDQGPTDRAALEQAMMGRFNADSAKQNAAQEAAMAARGMSPGSTGYGSMQDAQTRARTDAVNQAYIQSGQESRAAQQAYNQAQNQRFGQGLQAAQFGNAAQLQGYQMGQDYAGQQNNLRQGQMQERLALRNQPINEITALMGGSQVNMPQFSPFSRQGISPANIGGYIENNYAQQAQQSANQNAGWAGMGSAAITGLFGL